MGIINWSRLKESGRVKDIGMPWSDKEAHAVFVLKISAEAVRAGCLTMEEYKDFTSSGKDITSKVDIENLKKECDEKGILYTEDASEEVLSRAIYDYNNKRINENKEDFVKDEETLICNDCGRRFKNLAGLSSHRRSAHKL